MQLTFLAIAPLIAASAADPIDAGPAPGGAASSSLGGRVAALVADLDDPDWSTRDTALSSLLAIVEQPGGRASKARVVDRLVLALEEAEVSTECALALGRIGTERARRALTTQLIWSTDERRALAVLGGLWYCATEADGEALMGILEASEPSSAVGRKAGLLLGRLRYEPATRLLIDRLHSKDRGEVADAHWALREVTGLTIRPDADLWESWWDRVGQHRDALAR